MKVFAECTNFMLGRELVESKSVRAPRSADFSATGRIRCGEQVCRIAVFQTRLTSVVRRAQKLRHKPIGNLRYPTTARSLSWRNLAISGQAAPSPRPAEPRLGANTSSIACHWCKGRNSKSTSLWHSHARLPPARETRGRVVLRDVSPGRFVA